MSLEAITRELRACDEIEFATLFGSRQAGTARSDSDWDVAIFLSEKLDKFERFRIQREIAAALAPAVDVIVVILNDVSALLAHRALGGDMIVQRSKEVWVRYFVSTMSRYFDQQQMRDFFIEHRRRRASGG